tara:strand:+ start:659 stop:847 length:189 start_codon:yes stop_codon:yes gene_type:complete
MELYEEVSKEYARLSKVRDQHYLRALHLSGENLRLARDQLEMAEANMKQYHRVYAAIIDKEW